MSISRQQHQQQLAAAAAAKSKRAYVLVPSALLICLLLYKAWGVVLLVTCALVLVSHTCYSLLYKDCLFDPRSLLLIKYVGELIIELVVILKLLTITGWSTIKHTNQLIKRWFEQRNETWKLANREDEDTLEMNGRRSSYRLSTSGTEFTSKASPITTGSYQSFALNGSCDAARTSTPISKGVGPHWRKDIKPNGSIGIFMDSPMPKKPSSLANENRYSNITSKQDATKYSQMPSWAITSSPKIREKGHGVKTVQTVAGPLLASTRYNVDPKVYIDINSPGITSRLSKYATEANNKLTHQPQYGTGQFPRVNLNATPIPVLSPKLSRSILPVTVRVAPPESNYPSVETQNQQERLKLYSGSSLELNDPKPSTSVSQVLKEISLKRHASREDIMLDLVKKQRTERISEGQLESLEEMMQKRAREDSSLASDEDDMPTQSKMQRPLKRQKASSCHDILNSLSSSANILSGVKRKATDTSQCNTEKHFKLANQSPSTSFSLTTSASIEESPKSKRQLNIEVPTTSNISNDATKLKQKSKHSELNSIESPKNNKTQLKKSIDSPKQLESKPVSPVIKKAEKLTDKLFMKPEPQNVDKIKNLQSDSVESKFKTNDKDEIRKEDIVNMRKNSMRQRLQSMFDAISGKTISKIDPDLVIQADELNTPSETSALTSLTSITSTTNVNTSPIATNIVPILKSDVEVKSPIKKTVTFNLPTSSAASDPQTSSTISTNANTNSKPTSTCSFNAPTTSASTGFSFSSNTTTVNTNSATTKPSTTGFTVSFHGTTTPGTTTATSPISSSASSPISNVANTSAVLSFGNANVNSSAKTSIEKPISSNLGKNSNEKKESGFTFGASASTAAPTSTTAPVAFGSSTSTLMFSAGSSSVTPTVTSRVTATTTATLEASKPVMSFSFGAGTPAATTASQSGFSFGGVGATTSAFSAPTKPASDGFAAPNNTQVSNPSAFGNSGNTTGFGAPTTKTSSPAFGNSSTSVGFGSSATTSSTFGPTASGFGSSTAPNAVPFGNANTTAPPAYGTSTTTSTIAFGNPSTTTAPTFGMSSPANPSAFGSATKPSLFGTSSTTASNLFSNSITATTASGSMFSASTTNTTSSIFGSQNKQETTGFGSVASKPNISTSTPSLFNAPTTSTSKQPTITSMFSASGGSSSSKQPTITSMFGKANSQATPTTTAPPAFGSNASSSIFSGNNNSNTSTTSPIFGGTSSASTIPNATNNSSIFGQSKAPTNSGFGSPAPTFGSAPGSSAFSAPTSNAFSVGVTNTNKLPTFDSIKPGSTPTFGAPTSNQSSAPSIFGSNTAFGSTTAPPPAYGASTGTSFGTASTTQSTASPFSVPSTTVASSASSLFANAASNATSASFSFSGNQASQQQQPTSSFSFGGSSGNSGSNVFQFGGASSAPKPASTGFNFSAPTGGPTINFSGSAQQAPAFNAPAPAGNMFSIGSGGSSTPRSRSARPTRRQR